MRYVYEAKNQNGIVTKGVVMALDRLKAEQLLVENGLVILSLTAQEESFISKVNPFGRGVKYKDLVLFSRQLATLIGARMPIMQSLRILEGQTTNTRLIEVTKGLVASVENGESLSLALSKHPEVFGNVYVSLVRSGESSGKLDKSLLYLADQLEKDYQLRSKVRSALIYPAFIVGTLFVVGLLMFKFVLPKIISVLEEQGGELPLVSKILILITNFVGVYWWLILVLMVVGGVTLRWYVATPAGRVVMDNVKIRAPIFSGIFKRIYLARFSRNLATLIAGGIPIIQALKIVAEVVNNEVYRAILLKATDGLSAGRSISDSIQGYDEFPPLVTQMVRVGEETAQLDEILNKLAEFYEKEVDEQVSTITTLLEPLIIGLIGLAVGALVAGVLLPIYNLANTIS